MFGPLDPFFICAYACYYICKTKKRRTTAPKVCHPTLDNILNQQKNIIRTSFLFPVFIEKTITFVTLQLNLLPAITVPGKPVCPAFLYLAINSPPVLITLICCHIRKADHLEHPLKPAQLSSQVTASAASHSD